MSRPTIYGPSYSTYVRTARLALEEKGAPYELVDVAMLAGAHQEADHRKRHPFGRLPAFAHDGLSLYETGAITRYVDRALPGPSLQPSDPKALARTDQVMSIVDAYAYGCMIGQLAWQRLVVPLQGGEPDETIVAASLPRAELCLSEFARLLDGLPWFGGSTISLADLHLAPIMAYVSSTPEGADLLAAQPRLNAWWGRMSGRPSMVKTAPQLG